MDKTRFELAALWLEKMLKFIQQLYPYPTFFIAFYLIKPATNKGFIGIKSSFPFYPGCAFFVNIIIRIYIISEALIIKNRDRKAVHHVVFKSNSQK